MLTIEASDDVKKKWAKSMEYFYALHLGALSNEVRSAVLKVETLPIQRRPASLYRCELLITPYHGHVIKNRVDRENCSAAIDYAFAKAKRTLTRRARGVGKEAFFRKTG